MQFIRGIRHEGVDVEEGTAIEMAGIDPLHHALEAFAGKNVEQDHDLLSGCDARQFRRLVETSAGQQFAVVARLHQRGLRGEGQTDDRVLLEHDALERCPDFLRGTAHGQRRDAQQWLIALHVVAEFGQQSGNASGKRRRDACMTLRRQHKDGGHFQGRGQFDDFRLHSLHAEVGCLLCGQLDRAALWRRSARL